MQLALIFSQHNLGQAHKQFPEEQRIEERTQEGCWVEEKSLMLMEDQPST